MQRVSNEKKKEITAENLAVWRKRCFIAAAKSGHPELAEDFFGDFTESIARGWRQTVDQSIADSLRRIYGRAGSCRYNERVLAARRTFSLDDPTSKDAGSSRLGEFIADPGVDAGVQPGIGPIIDRSRMLTARQRQILIAYYENDMNEEQIAETLGVSASRVNQLKKKLLEH